MSDAHHDVSWDEAIGNQDAISFTGGRLSQFIKDHPEWCNTWEGGRFAAIRRFQPGILDATLLLPFYYAACASAASGIARELLTSARGPQEFRIRSVAEEYTVRRTGEFLFSPPRATDKRQLVLADEIRECIVSSGFQSAIWLL